MELKIGSYTVVCEVTHKASGYFTTATFNLNVTSDFSQGFYVLKETADGNTELDFYNHLKKTTNNDLLAKVLEAPLAGEPRNLSTVFRKRTLTRQRQPLRMPPAFSWRMVITVAFCSTQRTCR